MSFNVNQLLSFARSVTSYAPQNLERLRKTLVELAITLQNKSTFSPKLFESQVYLKRLILGDTPSLQPFTHSYFAKFFGGLGALAATSAACTPKDLKDLLEPSVEIPPTLPITPTEVPTPEGSITPNETPTLTPVVSHTPSTTPTVTPFASNTPELTPTGTPSATPDNTPSLTATPEMSVTPSVTPTASNTPSVSPTETPADSLTPSVTPSSTPNAPTATPEPTFTATPHAPTATALATTDTPTPEPTPEPTPYPATIQHDTGDAAFVLRPGTNEVMLQDELSTSRDGAYALAGTYNNQNVSAQFYLLRPSTITGEKALATAQATLTEANPAHNVRLDTCKFGDMTQDGKDDAICILQSTNSTDSYLAIHSDVAKLIGEKTSDNTSYQLISDSASRITDILSIGYFTDDGKDDMLVVNGRFLSVLTKPVIAGPAKPMSSNIGLALEIPYNGEFAQGFPTLAAVGDVNGDGHSDFLVGNPDATVGDIETAGAAYLVLGRAIPVPNANAYPIENQALKIVYSETNPQANSLGYAVGGAGDVNHDGLADLALYVMNQGAYSTRIIFGNANFEMGKTLVLDELPLDASLSLYSTPSNALSNEGPRPTYSTLSIGDQTDDGVSDLIIGLPESVAYADLNYTEFLYSGTVYLADLTRHVGNPTYYADWSTDRWRDTSNPYGASLFGACVAAGDINGNGPRGLITTSLSGVYGFDLW